MCVCKRERVRVCLQERKSVCVSAREKECVCVCVCPLRTWLKNFKVVQWLKSAGRLKLHRHENMNAAAAAAATAEAAGNKKKWIVSSEISTRFFIQEKI